MWVSPFRDLRVNGYLLLTAAYRSLSRLSSALSAKASTLRSSSLDLVAIRSTLFSSRASSEPHSRFAIAPLPQKWDFCGSMTDTGQFMAVSHSSFSFLRIDNGLVYSVILHHLFFEIEFILIN